MAKELWIFAEQNGGVIAPSFYEILSKAKSVYVDAKEHPCFVAVVLAGDDAVITTLKDSGADKIVAAVDSSCALRQHGKQRVHAHWKPHERQTRLLEH